MSAPSSVGSFLRFRVGDCELALEIEAVEKVIRLMEKRDLEAPIPGIDGTIPLHGQVVPVLFLSRLLGIQAGDPRMAVVALGRGHQVALGVNEVVGLYGGGDYVLDSSPVPGLRGRGVQGIHRVGLDLVSWLDIDGIFSEEKWEAIRSLSEMGTEGLLGDSTLDILGY